MRESGIAGFVFMVCLSLLLSAESAAQGNLQNQGGPVMVNPRVHLIFWLPPGDHLRNDGGTTLTDESDRAVVGQFIQDLGGSAYFNIANQYCGSNGCPGTVSLASTTVYTAAYPESIQSSDIVTAVLSNMSPSEAGGGLSDFYAVFLAAGVTQQGQENYHLFFYLNGTSTPVIYALVVGGTQGPSFEDDTLPTSPNGVVDLYITNLAHELMESVTDPLVETQEGQIVNPAWMDPTVPIGNSEIADKCETSGGTQQPPDGADLVIGYGDRYLVQQMWSNGALDPTHFGLGSCQMSNPAVTRLIPQSGPNGGGTYVLVEGGIFDTSGGTQVTFAGTPATTASCPVTNFCIAVSPPNIPYGPENGAVFPYSAAAPVNVTVGDYTSATQEPLAVTFPTVFAYEPGPACQGTIACPSAQVGEPPNLTVACPSEVYFWDQEGHFVGSGTSFTQRTNDPGDGVYACQCQVQGHRICARRGCCPPGAGSSCTFFPATVPPSQWCGKAPPPPPPPLTCNRIPRPRSGCSAGDVGWKCCSGLWHCGLCD
jgi:hypothetical protein